MNLTMREDKYKTTERIENMEKHSENITKLKDDIERQINSLTPTKVQNSSPPAEELTNNIQSLKNDLTATKRNTEENKNKIYDCTINFESLKDIIEKIKIDVMKRSTSEDIGKNNELSDKLFKDLSLKIDNVDNDNHYDNDDNGGI